MIIKAQNDCVSGPQKR